MAAKKAEVSFFEDKEVIENDPKCLHPSVNIAGLNNDAKFVLACSIDSFFNDLVYMMQCSGAVDR